LAVLILFFNVPEVCKKLLFGENVELQLVKEFKYLLRRNCSLERT